MCRERGGGSASRDEVVGTQVSFWVSRIHVYVAVAPRTGKDSVRMVSSWPEASVK